MTIRTVAADAGVSVSAVSKVLRNAYGVSEALRRNVQESIERLGYRPSSAARGMRGRTFTVGILLVGLDNPFLNKVITGINSALGAAGYKSMFGVGGAETHIETPLIESMIDFKMDGLIVIAPRVGSDTLAEVAAQLPLVAVAHHEPGATVFDTVNSDDQQGAGLAVRALIDRGHSDIAMLSQADRTEDPSEVWVQREIGYRAAMASAGLSSAARLIRAHEKSPERDATLDELLTSANRPRAIFCWSDLLAVPILNRARQLGVLIPEDLALVGYDNSPVAELPLIDLASIRQSAHELGETAGHCILSRMDGRREAEHHLIEPELILRGSV